jgi:hypothetical protein
MKEHKAAIREKIVTMIRAGMQDGQPSKFWCEGPVRHGIRSSLCLQGWSWSEADATASEIVTAALNIVGAVRPSWPEGQPEWAQQGAGALIERTRCVHCHKPLEGIQRKFCSGLCCGAHRARLNAIISKVDGAAYDYVVGRKRRDWLDEA